MIERKGIRGPHRRATAIGVAIGLAILATGCGGSGPEMAQVSGKVSYQGKPLEAGVIAFVSTQPERPNASGPIGADGTYSLQTREPGDGAQLGEYQVTITDVDPEVLNSPLPGEPVEVVSKIPPKYQAPTTSGLTRTVESGSNTFDFDLQ